MTKNSMMFCAVGCFGSNIDSILMTLGVPFNNPLFNNPLKIVISCITGCGVTLFAYNGGAYKEKQMREYFNKIHKEESLKNQD